jgi:multidrug efflux pump subunit AcrA (membrane-fusion protein)
MNKTEFPRPTRRQWSILVVVVVVIMGVVGVLLSRNWWLSQANRLRATVQERLQINEGDGDHASDGSGATDTHAGHDEVASLRLSQQAQKNVGLELVTIEPRDFHQTITIPAMVIERPGRTEIKVSAQMTGIVTRIYAIRGEAVVPGQPLFDLRLTHEDLVATQSAYLQTVEKLDVIKREVTRLEKATSSGFVAGKRLLERQYERQQTEALLRAQRQALVLHGLSEEQVDAISRNRRLLQAVTIVAPPLIDCESCRGHEEFMQVSELAVAPGEHVSAGVRLCTLTDHCELYIEGKAFEQDAHVLNEAANNGAPVTAVVEGNGSGEHEVTGLRILYVENQIDVDSRALKFYLRLRNELVRNESTTDGHRFIAWRYKPGQRVEVLVPVQLWKNQIVLPVEAVIQEGAEWFVYQKVGDRFDRRPVHVEYRDQRHSVIETDGTLFPGDVVAGKGAYQIHLALKNKTNGGVDPHAGHNH